MKKVVTQGLWERREKRWKRENRRLLRRLTKAYEQLRDAEKKASGSALGVTARAAADAFESASNTITVSENTQQAHAKLSGLRRAMIMLRQAL